MKNPTTTRFYVKTVSQMFRAVRFPHMVIDSTTNLPVDEYTSKRAALMDARDRNRAAAVAADPCCTSMESDGTCPDCGPGRAAPRRARAYIRLARGGR